MTERLKREIAALPGVCRVTVGPNRYGEWLAQIAFQKRGPSEKDWSIGTCFGRGRTPDEAMQRAREELERETRRPKPWDNPFAP